MFGRFWNSVRSVVFVNTMCWRYSESLLRVMHNKLERFSYCSLYVSIKTKVNMLSVQSIRAIVQYNIAMWYRVTTYWLYHNRRVFFEDLENKQ